MARFVNPLLLASQWAEKKANPEAYQKRQAETPSMETEAPPPIMEADEEDINKTPEPSPVPQMDEESPFSPAPAPAPTEEAGKAPPVKGRKSALSFEALRSVVWAGSIMLGIVCSLLALLIGMIR